MRPFRILSMVVPLSLLLAGCGGHADYAKHGPFAVGTRELVIQGAPPLPATLWFPASNPDRVPEEIIYQSATEGLGPAGQSGPIKGRALADAPMAPGREGYPLVIFAPDRSRGRMLYAGLLEHWASHGFVVLAFGKGDVSAPDAIQVRWALALAESLTTDGGPSAGRIDTGRTALAGHGEGALAILAAAGQATVTDPRVKAVLALGPPSNAEELVKPSAVTVPALLVSGSRTRADPLYAGLASGEKAELILVHGGHDLFGPAPDEVAASMDIAPLDTGPWDIHRARGVIWPLTTAVLFHALKADPEAHRALSTGPVHSQNTDYASTWK